MGVVVQSELTEGQTNSGPPENDFLATASPH